jgi:hypothetical protein
MTHQLDGRRDSELLWTRRRDVLLATAATVGSMASGAVLGQTRSNIVALIGDARLNGRTMSRSDVIQPGDTVETGPGSALVFTISNSSFHLRQNTRMTIDRGRSQFLVSALRLVTGALVSVWGRRASRTITTPALTIGIRGTGVYTEAREDERTYFCNCYGTVDLSAGRTQVVSQADYHQSFWVEPERPQDQRMRPAQAINHSDEELEFLAALIGQQTRWQELGRKGMRDGQGYMEPQPPAMHPAAPFAPR